MMGEHLVLLSIEHGAYFEMNPTAKLIWDSLSRPCTIIELCEIVHEQYEVSEHYCRESIENFILALRQENMVHFTKPGIIESYQVSL